MLFGVQRGFFVWGFPKVFCLDFKSVLSFVVICFCLGFVTVSYCAVRFFRRFLGVFLGFQRGFATGFPKSLTYRFSSCFVVRTAITTKEIGF